MKVNFKFLTFCLFLTFLAISYKSGMLATKKKPGYTQKTTYSGTSLNDQHIYKNLRNNSIIPVLKKGGPSALTVPAAGTTMTINSLLNLIRKKNPNAYFIVFQNNASRNAKMFGFDNTWLQQNGNNAVTLTLNSQQIGKIQANGALPTATQINNIKALKINATKKAKIIAFLNALLERYTNSMVSFKATNAKGETYDLFLIDPWPGKIITSGTRYNVPAANILNKIN